MQVRAVKVSLTAGDRALMAISTSWSMAKTGSCISVRCGPVTCALDRASLTCSAAPRGQTVARGRPATTKCPGRWLRRMTASNRDAMATSCAYPTNCR